MNVTAERTLWTPESFAAARVINTDFDGTIGDTLTQAPSGIGVEEACETAVDAVFGPQKLRVYLDSGGLQNRAPKDVVGQLAPDATEDEATILTDRVVTIKLAVLLDQIDTDWPQLMPGYREFETIRQAAADRAVSEVIISSGHASFIEKAYSVWGIRLPDIILGQEAVAALALAEGIPLPTKPNSILMLYAYNAWRGLHGLETVLKIPYPDLRRMCYVGDDVKKDGALARGMWFYPISKPSSENTWREVSRDMKLEATLSMDETHA